MKLVFSALFSIIVCALLLMMMSSSSQLFTLAFTTPDPSISLSFKIVKPLVLFGDVEVSWSVPSSQDISNDWISLWWEPVNATYIQYFNVSQHSGSFTVKGILNARHRYIFRYFRGNDSIQETDFFSPVAHVPMHPRLTFVDEEDATKMRLSWTCDRVTPKSAVFLGTDPKQLNRVIYVLGQKNYTNTVFPPVDTYTLKSMTEHLQLPPTDPISKPWPNIGCRCLRCSYYCYNDYTILKLFADAGLFLNVEIDNLEPGREYFYKFGEVGGEISQDVRSFVARTPASPNATVNILYLADGGFQFGKPLNETRGSLTDNDPPINGAGLVYDLLKRKIDIHDKNKHRGDKQSPSYSSSPFAPPLYHYAIFNGDMTYARGESIGYDYFHNLTSQGLFDRIPVDIQNGNHETDFAHNSLNIARGPDSGGESGIVAGKRFLLDPKNPYYYRTYGPAFMIGLSSEHPLEPQLKWLQETIIGKNKIDRAVTPWLVVFLHRPMHSLMQYDYIGFTKYLNQYSDVFDEMGVDLVLQGHQHQYTRLCAISSGVCNTWGFQAVYQTYLDTELTPASTSSCTLDTPFADTSNQCRVLCNKNDECTGVQWNAKSFSCVLLKCKIDENTQYSRSGATIFSLARKPGKSPVFIVDGSAGAEFSTPAVPNDPRVRYTDVKKWGFSTLTMNRTTLHWQHFHLDDRVADDLILSK